MSVTILGSFAESNDGMHINGVATNGTLFTNGDGSGGGGGGATNNTSNNNTAANNRSGDNQNAVNQFYGNSANIQAQLNQVAVTYIDYYWARQEWFKNPANANAIAMAVDVLGMPPAVIDPYGWRKNYQSWCFAFGPLVNIYELAVLFDKYQIPEPGTQNFCRILKALLFSLDDEQIAADRLFIIQNDNCVFNAKTMAINAIKSKIQNLYNVYTCEVFIQNENAQNQINQNQQIQDHSTELQLQQQKEQALLAMQAAQQAFALQQKQNASNAANVANVSGTGLKGTNSFMVYTILGAVVILLVGSVVVFKKKTD